MKKTETIVSAEGLSKVFHDFWLRPRVKAVGGIDFEIRRGEVFGLLGPNGSGKSTTIKMMLGLLFPSAGTLRVLGQSPRDVKTKQRIGYLPEESYLYPYLTARETLKFYASLFALPAEETRQRIGELLDLIGLSHTGSRKVGEFSKGMMRRIGLAQSIINDPELVILDEPTSGLDPLGVRQVKDLILHLAERGKTVLLSSHLLADVEDVCDRVAILYNGKIQAMGGMDELLEERSRQRFTTASLTSEQTDQTLAFFRDELRQEAEVDHPRRNLERFFLEVVERARRDHPEATGTGAEGQIDRFMKDRPDA